MDGPAGGQQDGLADADLRVLHSHVSHLASGRTLSVMLITWKKLDSNGLDVDPLKRNVLPTSHGLSSRADFTQNENNKTQKDYKVVLHEREWGLG